MKGRRPFTKFLTYAAFQDKHISCAGTSSKKRTMIRASAYDAHCRGIRIQCSTATTTVKMVEPKLLSAIGILFFLNAVTTRDFIVSTILIWLTNKICRFLKRLVRFF